MPVKLAQLDPPEHLELLASEERLENLDYREHVEKQERLDKVELPEHKAHQDLPVPVVMTVLLVRRELKVHVENLVQAENPETPVQTVPWDPWERLVFVVHKGIAEIQEPMEMLETTAYPDLKEHSDLLASPD